MQVKSSLNYLIYTKWLLNLTELKPFEEGLSGRRLRVFNDAYYICTLTLMHPTNEDYTIYAIKRCSIPSVVFPIVYLYISKVNVKGFSITRFLSDIKTGLKSKGWDNNLNELIKCTEEHEGYLSASEFAQRDLNPEVLSQIRWYGATKKYSVDGILNIVRYIAKNEDDWRNMLDAIKNAAEDYQWEYNNELEYLDDEGKWCRDTPLDMSPVYRYIDELKEQYDEMSLHEDRFQTPSLNKDTSLRVQIGKKMENLCPTSNEWDNRYDGFLKENVDAQKIFEALQNINSPQLPKTERGYWWTFYEVITEINWTKDKVGNQKLVLQWANQHFNCGWDWKKPHLFKFSYINKEIKNSPSNEWKKETTKSSIGLYYGELARQMKAAFVEFVEGGKLMDRGIFIKGNQRINNGH